MFFCGRSRWGLVAPAGLAMLLAGPAWGQQGEQGKALEGAASVASPPGRLIPAKAIDAPGPAAIVPVPTAAPDPLSPSQLMNGPSLHETGRIAVAPAPAPTQIENDRAQISPKEKSISPAASEIDVAPAAAASGFIDPRVLDKEITERFAQIANCRVEVARAKQVTPSQVVADKLLLRWIIEADGTTGSTDVVATAPVDASIMDCAKRVMSQWRFTPPRGGHKAVERQFSFWRSSW
jgi:hypothetical protein